MSSLFHRTPLYDHAVATVDGFVYASAGSVEGKASLLLQEKVQCYSPHNNDWDFVAPMQEARAKAAAVEHEGLLYVTGKEGVDLFGTEVIWVLTQSIPAAPPGEEGALCDIRDVTSITLRRCVTCVA